MPFIRPKPVAATGWNAQFDNQFKEEEVMELTLDEQRLITAFRKLTPSAREELLAAATSLLRRTVNVNDLTDSASNQCQLKPQDSKPESAKTPIFTE